MPCCMQTWPLRGCRLTQRKGRLPHTSHPHCECVWGGWERRMRGGNGRKGGCHLSTLSILTLYFLTSAICPRSQPLCYREALYEAVMSPPVTSSSMGAGGFNTKRVTIKFQLHLWKVLKWIWLTSGDGWANSSCFTEMMVSKGNDSGELCAPPPNPTAHPRSSQNSQHCA